MKKLISIFVTALGITGMIVFPFTIADVVNARAHHLLIAPATQVSVTGESVIVAAILSILSLYMTFVGVWSLQDIFKSKKP